MMEIDSSRSLTKIKFSLKLWSFVEWVKFSTKTF